MTQSKVVCPEKINSFSIVKVLYTVKTLELAVGCFELLDTYPHLPCTVDFEKTLKGTVNNLYQGLEVHGEVWLTELTDEELLDGSIRPRDFAITIN